MAGVITLKFSVMKNGMADLGMKSPIFHQGPVEPQFGPGRYLTFEGFSVDENGKQHYMDASVAYRQTTLRVIEYLRRFGYSDYQVYLLLSCAPVQGHIAGIVDVSFVGGGGCLSILFARRCGRQIGASTDDACLFLTDSKRLHDARIADGYL
jgi:acetamidase/formamidase